MYADDNVDEGLVVVLVDNSKESVFCDSKLAELLGQVFGLIRVVKGASIVVQGELLVAVAKLKAHKVFNEVLQCGSRHVDRDSRLVNAADWAFRVRGPVFGRIEQTSRVVRGDEHLYRH